MLNQPHKAKSDSDCKWKTQIPAYIQGELSGEKTVEFENHLAECLSCQEGVSEVRDLIKKMQSVPEEPLKHDLAPQILERIPENAWTRDITPLPSKRWRLFFIGKIAACFLLAVLIGLAILHFWKECEQPSEDVVAQALNWLKKSQEPSGEWDAEKWGGQKNYTVGLTGLALLTFLGRDENPLQGQYTDTVNRGIEYLLKQQRRDGCFGPMLSNSMYNHGIATISLLETYGLGKDKRLKKPIDLALNYIRTTQTPQGGWGYLSGSTSSENTSISAWQLHALLLARTLGWKDTGTTLKKGLAWLKTAVDEEGRIGYRRKGDFPYGCETLTAMGALYLLAGNGEDGISRKYNIKIKHSLKRFAFKQSKDIDYYRWYFLTYALQTLEEVQSNQCVANLQKTLAKKQIKAGPNSGSWEPDDRWSSAGGRIYSTAMATLSLETNRRGHRITNWMKKAH